MLTVGVGLRVMDGIKGSTGKFIRLGVDVIPSMAKCEPWMGHPASDSEVSGIETVVLCGDLEAVLLLHDEWGIVDIENVAGISGGFDGSAYTDGTRHALRHAVALQT